MSALAEAGFALATWIARAGVGTTVSSSRQRRPDERLGDITITTIADGRYPFATNSITR